MAHRLQLSASIMMEVVMVERLHTIVTKLAGYFNQSSKRASAYKDVSTTAGELRPALPLDVIVTRWLSLSRPLDRMLATYAILLLFFSAAPDAEGIYRRLTDFTVLATAYAVQPLLVALRRFCLAAQERGIYPLDLLAKLRHARACIDDMYQSENKFTGPEFASFNDLLQVGRACLPALPACPPCPALPCPA